MKEPRPYGRAWSRGNSEAGLLGFVDSNDKSRFEKGENGPFRRVIAPVHWGTMSTAEWRRHSRRQPERQNG